MKLHRATGRPDWAQIEPARRNAGQRLAAATHGIVTPGNVTTLIGLVMVAFGLAAILARHFWPGLIALSLGRLLDIADGWLAEATGTKSPLGEMLDATVDKLGTLATILVFFLIGLTAWWLLLALVLPHIIISLIVIVARRRNRRLHPSRLGKLSMAAAWVSLLGLVLIQATAIPPHSPVALTVVALAVISSAMGIAAAAGYLTDLG